MNKKSVKWNVSQGCCFHCSFCFSFVCCCGTVGTGLREHLPVKEPDVPTEPCWQGSNHPRSLDEQRSVIKSDTKTMH